jgi:polar amino acid transport system substrate-binding protein
MIRKLAFTLIILSIATATSAKKNLIFSTHNTAVNRICSQILLEAYQQLGIKVHIEQFPSKRSLLMSNTGQVDGEVCRVKGIEKEYSNLLRVPVTLQSFDAVVFTKKQGLSILGWDDLQPYRIGLMRGAVLAHQLTKGMSVHSGSTLEQLLLMLEMDRLDVIITERNMGLHVIKQLQLEGITIIEPPLITFNSYHYVHKQHAALIPNLVKVLQKMQISRMKNIQDQVYSKL